KGEINEAAGKLRSNAQLYGDLATQLTNALNNNQRFAGLKGVQGALRNRLSAYQKIRDDMQNPPEGALCLTGSAGERRHDPNCQCRQTNTCAKAEFGNVSFGNQQMPGFFTSSLGNAGAGANALFAGNTSAANSQFAQMGQNAAKIRKLHDQVKANADKVIKDKTKGKQSFADFEKDALNKLTKMSKQVIPKLAAEQPA